MSGATDSVLDKLKPEETTTLTHRDQPVDNLKKGKKTNCTSLMDHGGQNPRKTFVSTFRLDLKPPTPKFVSRGVEYVLNHTRGVRGQGNSRLRNSSTEHQQTPVHRPKVPHFKESQRNCTAETGSDITPKDTIAGSQALSVSLQQNSGRENAISAEAGSSSESSLALLGNGIASKRSSKDVGIKTCEDEDAGDTRSAALCTTEDKTKATSGQPSEKNLDTSIRPPSTHGDINPPRKEKIKGPSVEFQDHQEKVEVQIGGKARLHCAFSSICFPVASCWIHNREKVLVNSPRTNVESSKTESCVEISQACPGDAGCYTLVVRNRRGCGHHTVVLSVIDRPDPPASSPIVSHLSSKSLVLSWTGPSYDGGSAVTGYIVEVRQEVPDKPGDWIELTTECKNTSYRVRSGLEPLQQYCFRVRASNSVGVSEPSNVSDCIKMDSKGQDEGESISYVTVTINNTHKVQDHYNVNEKLGVGKFGQVFRLTHKETGQVCAGKFYKGRGSKDKGAARREIELMNCLHHPKLVQCLGAYDTRSEMVMVMEYIGGGELFKRIVDDNFEHNEPTCARYMQQILEGIQYVHKQKIIHLDLKPENIVCVDTTGTRIKIIDFGLARKLEPGVPLMVMHGTPEFVAPEVISYEPVGLKTDMWSIGVICYVLLSGESPFQGNSDAETLARVTAADYEFDEESFEDISDQAEDFINSLLKKDMRSRLSCEEALAHPWMVSFTSLIRRPTKSLRKDKMRRFLARRKWKKTGKAVLALKRMANLSNKPVYRGSSEEEPSWGPDAESAIQSLEQKLRSEPQFQQVLKDTTLPRGATARLACHVQGYPEPKVEWLQEEDLVEVSSRVSMEYDEDGRCALVLTGLVPADAGLYKCRATNDLGKALCTAKLTVKL